jgi:putative intracellular protease/amidase/YHS domain-containing protein
MKRADLLRQAAAVTALSAAFPVETLAADRTAIVPLKPPVDGVLVAFLLSDGAVMIDFAGPWEVFQDANVAGRTQAAFTPYTVAESTAPLTVSGGARILPQYEFARAPAPKVVVVPAQSDPSPATKQWLQKTARSADLMMSVCTGAFVLAKAGLLDGHSVTTHHNSLQLLAMEYPKLTVRRGARFVDDGHIARYYGEGAARQTAYDMEYQSKSWLNENANAEYGKPPAPRAGFALCAVCWMQVDPKTAPSSLYQGKHYYFCMRRHKLLFDSTPQRFLNVS